MQLIPILTKLISHVLYNLVYIHVIVIINSARLLEFVNTVI